MRLVAPELTARAGPLERRLAALARDHRYVVKLAAVGRKAVTVALLGDDLEPARVAQPVDERRELRLVLAVVQEPVLDRERHPGVVDEDVARLGEGKRRNVAE